MLAFGVKWIKLLKVPDLIVLRSDSFTNSLSNILIYIAHDSKNRARQFNKTLQASLKELPNMPYKFRKSIYFDDMKQKDVAEILGVTKGALSQRLNTILRKMRNMYMEG